MKAFVLCKLAPGQEQKTVEKLRGLDGVTEVYLVFGDWDVILMAEADTVDKLSSLIVTAVRGAPGVTATSTLVTTHL